ncbi:hypothetical protein [Catenulispora pinisilvae]|uniref:restriction system modified-DNA reader domain-containing protein n=1 Tax=Catenulispora pinisilvae TaxID=2705253 RepID=UPI001890E2C1|nr:hypothetical protein [Catenulispora pinisilvae]
MQTTTTALPAPHGPSAADLIAWWHHRSDVGGTTTERSCTAVATTVLDHLAHHASTTLQTIDMRTVSVEQLLADHADCLWPNLSTSTRNNYTNRLRRAVAEFLTALDDPAAVRPGRARARLDAARSQEAPRGAELGIEIPPAGFGDPGVYAELALSGKLTARIWVSANSRDLLTDILRRLAASPRQEYRRGLKPTLAPLLRAGLLEAGQELIWHRKRLGERLTVTVTADGQVQLPDGSVWPSPNQAAARLTGYPNDGWAVFRTADGATLADLKALASADSPEPDTKTIALATPADTETGH